MTWNTSVTGHGHSLSTHFVSTLIENYILQRGQWDTKSRAYSVKIGSKSAEGSSSNVCRTQVGGTLLEKRVEKHHQSLQLASK
jgi:hypothetical protein